MWGEACFIEAWINQHGNDQWNSTTTVKQVFSDLINRGQFEFVGGGWVQHDEALVSFEAMIDQMTGNFCYDFLKKKKRDICI